MMTTTPLKSRHHQSHQWNNLVKRKHSFLMSRTSSLEWKATVAAAVAERKIKGFQQPTSAQKEKHLGRNQKTPKLQEEKNMF